MISIDPKPNENLHHKYNAVKVLPGISKPDLETKLDDEGRAGWHFVNMIVLGTNNWLIFERIITK